MKSKMKAHLLPPSVSGHYYCLEDMLGEGSFGKVYMAHDLATPGVPVAVKLPKMELKLSGILAGYRRTMREVALLQRNSSQHVVQCLDYSRDVSFPYVVMEYVPQTLATLPITFQVIKDTIAQLPEIISDLSETRIAHCDLRENNIGYVERTLKLLDFGLAIPFEHSVIYLGRQAQGCLPQEFCRFNMVTKTTDTYSAGRVLERLLTGVYSPSPTRAIAKMREIYGQEPPKAFQRMLRRMLRHDHHLRPDCRQLLELSREALGELEKSNFLKSENIDLGKEVHFFGSSSPSSSNKLSPSS